MSAARDADCLGWQGFTTGSNAAGADVTPVSKHLAVSAALLCGAAYLAFKAGREALAANPAPNLSGEGND